MTIVRGGARPLVAFGLLALLTQPCLAQGPRAGDRVRVLQAGSRVNPIVGRLSRSTADSIWLSVAGQNEPVAVPLGPSTKVEVSLGHRSRAGVGALVGAVVGAVVTVGFLTGFCGGDTLCDGDEQVRAAALLGLPGVAVGAGVGALIRIERWSPVGLGSLPPTGVLRIGFNWRL